MAEFGLDGPRVAAVRGRPRVQRPAARRARRRRRRGGPADQHQRAPADPRADASACGAGRTWTSTPASRSSGTPTAGRASPGTTPTSPSARTSARRTATSRPAASTGAPSLRRSCWRTGRSSDDGAPGRFTTVGAWRGAFGVIERDGHTYGLKVHEFRKVIELPARVAARLRDRARHLPRRRPRPRVAGGARLAPRAPRRRGARTADVSPLRAGLGRRVLGRAGHLRRHEQRLVQRSQRAVPRLRPAGAAPGHGLQPQLPGRRGTGRVPHARRGRRRSASASPPTTTAHRAAARALAEERFDSDKVLPRFLAEAGWAGEPRTARWWLAARRAFAGRDRPVRGRRGGPSFELLRGDEARAPSRACAPVELAGAEETVFSWSRDRCADDDIPDLPARAFRDDRGRVAADRLPLHQPPVRRPRPGAAAASVRRRDGLPLRRRPGAVRGSRVAGRALHRRTAGPSTRSSTTSTRATRIPAAALRRVPQVLVQLDHAGRVA